jgi:uncharacterized membrane protein
MMKMFNWHMLFSGGLFWYWGILVFTVSAMILFFIPVDLLIVENLRIIFGGIFLLFLPGYSLIRLLFPSTPKVGGGNKGLDVFERFALSLGCSLVLAPLIGFFLNYTPWGITLAPVTIVLATLTIAFATVTIIIEFHYKLIEKRF